MIKGIGVAVLLLGGETLVILSLLLCGDAGVDNDSVAAFLHLKAV